MHWLFQRQRFGVRLIALAVTISFLYADVVQAQGFSQTPSSIQTIPVSDPAVSLDPLAGFELPPEVGQLKQAYLSNRHEEEKFPYVVHIQDSHANYPAQQNIDKILNRLFENGFNGYSDDVLICLEGAVGGLDLSLFRGLKDAKAKRVIADAYLKEGKINAAEFFALNQAQQIPLCGIEDAALYLENMQAHHDVVQVRNEVAPRLQKQIEENQLAKERSFPKVFLAFDEKTQKLYQDQIGLSEYLVWLSSEIEVDWGNYPNLKETAQALELQKSISSKGVAREREVLIEKLKQRLVKEDLAGLIKLSLEYRLGKMESLEFHSSLLTLAQIYKLNGIYPQLEKLVRFLEMQKKLNTEQAMVELNQLFAAVKAQFLGTEEERKIQQESEWLMLAKAMVGLEVSRDQWRAYLREKEALFQFADDRSVQHALNAAERFYIAAQKRDAALVQNTFQALKLHNKQIAILITGGFHTEGLLTQLRAADTSHMVIAPRLTEATDADLYQSLMEPALSPLQRYLLNAGNRLAAPSYLFSNVILGNNPELQEELQEADTFRFILEYLGYRAYQMQELGQNARTIEIELQQEMAEVVSQIKGKWQPEVAEYWEAYFNQIAATRFPRGLILSSTARLPDESVALLVVKGKQAFKNAIETHSIDGKQFVYGKRDLEEEALVQRDLVQLKKRAKARERLAKQALFKLKPIEKIDAALALGKIKTFLPQARKVLFGGVPSEEFNRAKELLQQVNLDVLALGMHDKEAEDVAKLIEAFRVGKEAMESPRDAETLIFEAIEAYEKAANYLQLRDTEQFLVSYAAAEKRGQLNDPQTLQNLLDVIDIAELMTTLAHYPWFAIEDQALSLASLPSTYAAMQQLVKQIEKGKEPREETRQVRKFLRSIWFVAQMDQIKNRDVAIAEAKAQQKIEEKQRQELGEFTDLFLAEYLLPSVDLLAEHRGQIAMMSTDIFDLLQAHLDNRSKPWQMEKDLSKFLGLPEDVQLQLSAFIEQDKELQQTLPAFVEQFKELQQTTPVFVEQIKELQQTSPAFVEQLKQMQQAFPVFVAQYKELQHELFDFIAQYKEQQQAPADFIVQYKKLRRMFFLFVEKYKIQQHTFFDFIAQYQELQQALPVFIAQYKESQQVPTAFIEKYKKLQQAFPSGFFEKQKKLEQMPHVFTIQFKMLQQAFPLTRINQYKKTKKELPAFIEKFKETYKKVAKELRPELTESEEAMAHPFWAQELPYIPKELVFQIRFAPNLKEAAEKENLSKKEKNRAEKNHFFVSNGVFFVDVHSFTAASLGVFTQEVKNQARNYLRSTRTAVQAERQTLSDLVRRYEVAVAAKNRAERKNIFIELKNFFADPKNQQAKEFYRSVLTKELTEKVKEKFWGFWNELREMTVGIYQFAEGGKWNLFFGRLVTAVPTLMVLVFLFSFFAGALHAQEKQPKEEAKGEPEPEHAKEKEKYKEKPKDFSKEKLEAPKMSDEIKAARERRKHDQLQFMESNTESLKRLMETQRKMISLHQLAMRSSDRKIQIKEALNQEYFSALLDFSQSDVLLDQKTNTLLPAPTQTHGKVVTFYNSEKHLDNPKEEPLYKKLIFSNYEKFDLWLEEHAGMVRYLDQKKNEITDILQITEMEKSKIAPIINIKTQTYQTTVYRFENEEYEHLIFASTDDFEAWYGKNKTALKAYNAAGELLSGDKDNLWKQKIVNGESITLVLGGPKESAAAAESYQWWGKRGIELYFEFGRKAKIEQAELAELDLRIAQQKKILDDELFSIAHRFVRFNPEKDKETLFKTVDSITLSSGQVIENKFQETRDLLDKIPAHLFIYREYPQNKGPHHYKKGNEITNLHQLGIMTEQNKAFQIWVYDASLGEELLLASGRYAVQAKAMDAQDYLNERVMEGLLQELVSRGIPEGMSLEEVKKAFEAKAKNIFDKKGELDLFPAFPTQFKQGHRYFAFAEATMKEGWINGIANLHEHSDLVFTQESIDVPADQKPMFQNFINEYGFPYLYLLLRDQNGQLLETTQKMEDGTEVKVPQKKMVGFFIRKGSQWLRLKSNEVDGLRGKYVMRVILDDKEAEGKEHLYLESELGNQLVFGENVLKEQVMQNRIGAFRTVVEIRDAKKNLTNLVAEAWISGIAASINAFIFFNPTYSGELTYRVIKPAVRAGYQLFVQSSQLPTALPVIDLETREGETKEVYEERVLQQTRQVLADLDRIRQANKLTAKKEIALSVFGVSITPDDAAELHRFIYEMGAVAFNKEFSGYDENTGLPKTTLTPDELDLIVLALFHTNWHQEREVTSRIDFLTSFVVNLALLSDFSDLTKFKLDRLEPNEKGELQGIYKREVSKYSHWVNTIAGGQYGVAATTAGAVSLTNRIQILQKVSDKAMELSPIPGGPGIRISSIIKSTSRIFLESPVYSNVPDVWEGGALTFDLFGFPLQIFGAIQDTETFIEGLENYGVLAPTDESQNWFEQLAATFAGSLSPIVSLEEHTQLKRRMVFLGYAKASLPERNRDDKTPNVYTESVPVYGVMGDHGIGWIWIPGKKALDEDLHKIKKEMRRYSEYQQVRGELGGAILNVTPGGYYNFDPTKGQFDEKEPAVFLNAWSDLTPSFFFSQKQAGAATQRWATWASIYDLSIRSKYHGAIGDAQKQTKILKTLYQTRHGIKRLEPDSPKDRLPLYVNAIDIRLSDEGHIAEYALQPGPNAFLANAYLEGAFNSQAKERSVKRSYQENYLSGENRATLRANIFAGDIEKYMDNQAPDWVNDLKDVYHKELLLWDAENGNLDDFVSDSDAANMLAESILIADALLQRMETEGEWRGVIWQDKEKGISSTEEMMAVFSLFCNMHKVTEKPKYRDAAYEILRYLGRKMWSPSGNYFYMGTHRAEKGEKHIVINSSYATDVQAISLLSLGPETIDYMIDPETDQPFFNKGEKGDFIISVKILEQLLDLNEGSYVEVKYQDQIIKGFDSTNKNGRLLIGKKEAEEGKRGQKAVDFKEALPAVFVEPSEYVCGAMGDIVDYFDNVVAFDSTTPWVQKEKEDLKKKIQNFGKKATEIEDSLKKLALRSSTGGVVMPISTVSNRRWYPHWDYRSPDVAGAVAPTILMGLQMKRRNPYPFGGEAWYNIDEKSLSSDPRDQSIVSNNRKILPWPKEMEVQASGVTKIMETDKSALFANTKEIKITDELEKLAKSLSKVFYWNKMDKDQQQDALKQWQKENPNWRQMTLAQRIEAGDPQPNQYDLQRASGKTFQYYDPTTNAFSYEEGGTQFEWTSIPSYKDVQKSHKKYENQIEWMKLETFVIKDGALRFVDPLTKQPLDEFGNKIGPNHMAVPYFIFKRKLIKDPDNKGEKIVDPSFQGNLMLDFLKEQFKNKSAHEQNQILRQGWLETDVEFEQPNKTKKTVRALVIIEHGLSSALENLDLKKADDQALDTIYKLSAMQTQSGVIETDEQGALKNLYLGEEEVIKILNWLRADPDGKRMMAAYKNKFADFEYIKKDGNTSRITLVFGKKMGEDYSKELNERLAELNKFMEELEREKKRLENDLLPTHPERLNGYLNVEVNKETGEVFLTVDNLYVDENGEYLVEIQSNNKVIRQTDPRKKLITYYHPHHGSKYPWSIQSTDPSKGKRLHVPIGLNELGGVKYGYQDNTVKTFIVWIKDKKETNKTNKARFQFSLFKGIVEKEGEKTAEFVLMEADHVKTTFNWETGEVTRDFSDDDNNLLLRLKGTFEYKTTNQPINIQFLEREEREYIKESEFSVGDLKVSDLINSLKDNRISNGIILEKLNLTKDQLNNVSADALVHALNEIQKMRDFYSLINIDTYKSFLNKEMQDILNKVQKNEATLNEQDYKRLNRALLEAIYPHEILKSQILILVGSKVYTNINPKTGDFKKDPADPKKILTPEFKEGTQVVTNRDRLFQWLGKKLGWEEREKNTDGTWKEWTQKDAWDQLELNRHNGWSAIEFTTNTGVKKLSLLDAEDVAWEYSREKVTLFKYNPQKQLSEPLIELDLTGRTGLEVVVKETNKERKLTNALVVFLSTEKDSGGNIISRGITQAGKLVIYQRNHLGYLLNYKESINSLSPPAMQHLVAGDLDNKILKGEISNLEKDFLQTTYIVKEGKEQPVTTTRYQEEGLQADDSIVWKNLNIKYKYDYQPDYVVKVYDPVENKIIEKKIKAVFISAYDLRTNTVETTVQDTANDQLLKILTGTFQILYENDKKIITLFYDSRTDVEYNKITLDGVTEVESQRRTYINVNPTDGSGGKIFESSEPEFTPEGAVTLHVINASTQKDFYRELDTSKHLSKERDEYDALHYKYDLTLGFSVPVRKTSHIDPKTKEFFPNKEIEISKLEWFGWDKFSDEEKEKYPGGKFKIVEESTLNPEDKKIQIRNHQMRLLYAIHELDFTESYYDGSLAEQLLYKVDQKGTGGLSLKVIKENGVKRLPKFKYDAENNIVVNWRKIQKNGVEEEIGEVQYDEDLQTLANKPGVEIPIKNNVVSVYCSPQKLTDPGTELDEYTLQGYLAGKFLKKVKRDPFGRIFFQKNFRYAPIAIKGDFKLDEELTTTKKYDPPSAKERYPSVAAEALTTSSAGEVKEMFQKLEGQGKSVSWKNDRPVIEEWERKEKEKVEQTEKFEKGEERFQGPQLKVSESVTGSVSILDYDPMLAMDEAARKAFKDEKVKVFTRRGDRAFRLRNMGYSEFVAGGRLFNYVAAPVLNTFFRPSDGYAWFRINLGLVYSYATPLKPPKDVVVFDASQYDRLTFWVKGKSGGEKYAITLTDYKHNIHTASYTDEVVREATNEWTKVSLNLKEIPNLDLKNLIQLGIQYGNKVGKDKDKSEVGNPVDAEILVSNFMFEKQGEQRPVLFSSGEISGAGDFEKVDPSLTEGYVVPYFFTEETLPREISKRPGEFSYLVNEKGCVIGTTDFLCKDKNGTEYFCVWRYAKGEHRTYHEDKRVDGAIYRVEGYKDLTDTKYLSQWKERVYFTTTKIPRFSVYENNYRQYGIMAGQLRRLFQGKREFDPEKKMMRFMLWERDIVKEKDYLYVFWADGTSEEYYKLSFTPPEPDWDKYERSLQPELVELQNLRNWESKYQRRWEQQMTPKETKPVYWAWGYWLAVYIFLFLGVTLPLLQVIQKRLQKSFPRLAKTKIFGLPILSILITFFAFYEGIKMFLFREKEKNPYWRSISSNKHRASHNINKEAFINQAGAWIKNLGFTDEELKEMQIFLKWVAWPQFRNRGVVAEDGRWHIFVDSPTEKGETQITLQRYLQRMAILRFMQHWGSSQLAEYLVDEAQKLDSTKDNTFFKNKLKAYRDVAYKLVTTQANLPKTNTKVKIHLKRWNILFFEDVSALARYIREGKIAAEEVEKIEFGLNQIEELNKRLTDEKSINRYVQEKFQEALHHADEKEGFPSRKIVTDVSWRNFLEARLLLLVFASLPTVVAHYLLLFPWHISLTMGVVAFILFEIKAKNWLIRGFEFFQEKFPIINGAVYFYKFLKDMNTTLLSGGKWGIWKKRFGILVGLSVGAFVYLLYDLSWHLSIVAGLLLFFSTVLGLRLLDSSKIEGKTSTLGVFFWMTSLAGWVAWNFGKALPVWYAGVFPYYELLLQPGFMTTFSGGLLLGLSIVQATYFLILSYFAITWFLGGFFSIGIMEKNQQARIKATRAPTLKTFGKYLFVFVVVLSIVYFIAFATTYVSFSQRINISGIIALGRQLFLWTAGFYWGAMLLFFFVNLFTRAGSLDKMIPMLREEYTEKEKDSEKIEWKQKRLKRIKWEYGSLILDLHRSSKLTKEEYQVLTKGKNLFFKEDWKNLFETDEKKKEFQEKTDETEKEKLILKKVSQVEKEVSEVLSHLKIKEAIHRLKFWANAHLRKDKLSNPPDWDHLLSLTLFTPTVDSFRLTWKGANQIDKSSGESRFYKLLQGGYRAEFEIFLAQAASDKWATPEQISLLRHYMDNGFGVCLPPFKGPKASRLTQELEDWINDRLQMVETTLNGFLRVKRAYQEAAIYKLIEDKKISEDVLEKENLFEALSLDQKKEVEELVKEKFQMMWSFSGPWVKKGFAQFKNIPKGEKANRDGEWDLVLEMWRAIELALTQETKTELLEELKNKWVKAGILRVDITGKVVSGPEFDKQVQAEAMEQKLKEPWQWLVVELEKDSKFDLESLKKKVSRAYLGFAVVHDVTLFANHSEHKLGTGSPKAQGCAAAMPYVRGETVMFFDGDTEIRLEDARKLLQVLNRFNEDPKLGGLQFRQYIFNEAYNRQTQVATEAVNSFWGALLRLKSRFGSVGFYGHNGIFRTQALMDCETMQPSHISEDLLIALALRSYGWNVGYEDRLQLGEGEETLNAMYAGPTGKWAQGSTRPELQSSRVFKLYLLSPNVPFAEKIDTLFNLGFYGMVHYFSVPAIFSFVLGSFIIGTNPFTVLHPIYIAVGWGMSQSIGIYSLSQFWERNGYFEGTLKWMAFLFLQGGFFYWTALIGTQTEGLKKGLKEKGAWFTAAKDQGTESYTWANLFFLYYFGILVALPLLSITPLFAPLTPWLLLVPALIFFGILLWHKRIIPFEVMMAILWVAPLVVSVFVFNTGGGVLLSALFYLYVLISFIVSPFAFNTNPARLRVAVYEALATLENDNEKFSEVGLALSQSENKVNRVLELSQDLQKVIELRGAAVNKEQANVNKLLNELLKEKEREFLLTERQDKRFTNEDGLLVSDYLFEFYRPDLKKVREVLNKNKEKQRIDRLLMLIQNPAELIKLQNAINEKSVEKVIQALNSLLTSNEKEFFNGEVEKISKLAFQFYHPDFEIPREALNQNKITKEFLIVIKKNSKKIKDLQKVIENKDKDKEIQLLKELLTAEQRKILIGKEEKDFEEKDWALMSNLILKLDHPDFQDIREALSQSEQILKLLKLPSMEELYKTVKEQKKESQKKQVASLTEEERSIITGKKAFTLEDGVLINEYLSLSVKSKDYFSIQEILNVRSLYSIEKIILALNRYSDERVLEILNKSEFDTVNLQDVNSLKDMLDKVLSGEEKKGQNLEEMALLMVNFRSRLKKYFSASSQEKEKFLKKDKIWAHLLGQLFEEDSLTKPKVKEQSIKIKMIKKVALISSIFILILMLGLTASEAIGLLNWTSSLSLVVYRLLWWVPIFILMGLGGVKGVSIFIIELFLLPITMLAWLVAILSHYFLKKESAAQTIAHVIVFVVQRARVAYRERLNALIQDWQEEVLRNQDQEYLASLGPANRPTQGGEGSAPTKSSPPATPSTGTSPKGEMSPESLTKVQIKAPLPPETEKTLLNDVLAILAKPDESPTSIPNAKPFALRRGIQLEEKIQQAKLKKSVQLMVNSAGNLLIKQADGEKAPAWVEMFDAAIPLLVKHLKQDETLSSYWLELLSRDDNRAPPVLNVTPDLDGKTSSIRQPYLIDGKIVQVDILFSEQFIQTLLSLYPKNQEVVSWILAERLFHELGHTNAQKSPQESFDEEVRLIEKDFRLNKLIRQPVAGGILQERISSFISKHNLGPLFPGYYFNFLKEVPLGLTAPQQQERIADFARASLHVGEFFEAEPKELAPSEEKINETEVAQTILKKILTAAEANQINAVSLLNQLALPVEAGQTKPEALRQLLADTTKHAMTVDLVASLVQTGPALTIEQFQQILSVSNQSMAKQEAAFLASLQEQQQKQRERQDNILSRIESLLVANAMKPAPELVIFDSSLLKTLKSDSQVIALLKKYHSTVAIAVMKEDEKDPIIAEFKAEKFIVSYERETQGLSLETTTFNKVKAQYPQIAYAKTLVMTLEQSSSKWSWQSIYTYHVFVNKGNTSWSQWHPAALNEALQKLGISWNEFIRSQVPPPTGEELDIHGHVLLISA